MHEKTAKYKLLVDHHCQKIVTDGIEYDQSIACTLPFFHASAINVCRIDHTSQFIDKSCPFCEEI